MTEHEIVRSLKLCKKTGNCDRCPLFFRDNCKDLLLKEVLDLINRKKAEIKDLQMDKQNFDLKKQQIKSEAIKEFAERLKEKISASVYTYWNYSDGGYYLAEDCHFDIDDLVEEMTEGK